MSRKNSDHTKSTTRHYGPPSADYEEVIAHNGLKRPANDNGRALSAKTKNLLKIGICLIGGLAFLAWF